MYNFYANDSIESRRAWLYNISDEEDLNNKIFPNMTDRESNYLMQCQEQQILFYAKPGDTVILKNEIESEYLAYIKKWISNSLSIFYDIDAIRNLDNYTFIPFINCGKVSNLNQNVFGPSPEIGLLFNDKIYTRKFSQDHGFKVTPGKICHDIKEIEDYYNLLDSEVKVVLKSSYGSSGKGIKILNSKKHFNSFLTLLKRRNKKDHEIIIEEWLEDSISINCSMMINESYVKIINITQQIIDSNGVYKGTNYTPEFDKKTLMDYEYQMIKLGRVLQKLGYRGVLGIDSIINKGILYPIIEINARFTQVIYLNNLVEKLLLNVSINSIVTSYRNFKIENNYSFSSIKDYLDKKLDCDEKNNYIVYTYGKHSDEEHTTYRLYVLFYGESNTKVNEFLNTFKNEDFRLGEE